MVSSGKDKIEGGISIVEGSIRIRFADGSLQTLHSNHVYLDEPETPLRKMVDQHIDVIYRPWEEKEENIKYKEEKKKAERNEAEVSLFATPEEQDDSLSDLSADLAVYPLA